MKCIRSGMLLAVAWAVLAGADGAPRVAADQLPPTLLPPPTLSSPAPETTTASDSRHCKENAAELKQAREDLARTRREFVAFEGWLNGTKPLDLGGGDVIYLNPDTMRRLADRRDRPDATQDDIRRYRSAQQYRQTSADHVARGKKDIPLLEAKIAELETVRALNGCDSAPGASASVDPSPRPSSGDSTPPRTATSSPAPGDNSTPPSTPTTSPSKFSPECVQLAERALSVRSELGDLKARAVRFNVNISDSPRVRALELELRNIAGLMGVMGCGESGPPPATVPASAPPPPSPPSPSDKSTPPSSTTTLLAPPTLPTTPLPPGADAAPPSDAPPPDPSPLPTTPTADETPAVSPAPRVASAPATRPSVTARRGPDGGLTCYYRDGTSSWNFTTYDPSFTECPTIPGGHRPVNPAAAASAPTLPSGLLPPPSIAPPAGYVPGRIASTNPTGPASPGPGIATPPGPAGSAAGSAPIACPAGYTRHLCEIPGGKGSTGCFNAEQSKAIQDNCKKNNGKLTIGDQPVAPVTDTTCGGGYVWIVCTRPETGTRERYHACHAAGEPAQAQLRDLTRRGFECKSTTQAATSTYGAPTALKSAVAPALLPPPQLPPPHLAAAPHHPPQPPPVHAVPQHVVPQHVVPLRTNSATTSVPGPAMHTPPAPPVGARVHQPPQPVHAPPKPAPHASQRPAQTTHITPQPPVKAAVPQRQGHQQPAAKPVRQVHQKPAAKPVRQVHQQPAAKPVRQVHQQPAAKALPQRPLVPVRAAPMAHKKR